jgi:hypothetical protein
MAFLTKEAIFSADDIKTEEVNVPEWGGEVLVKTLTGRERDAFENSVAGIKNGQRKENYANFRARFVAHCVVDENGNRLFARDEDVEKLGRKSVKALQRVFNKAQELNAMTDEDVEDLVEDFEVSPDENSSSD